jgi:hypothetical protein
MGRLKKVGIENAIGNRIQSKQIILCSDAQVIYKGFVIEIKFSTILNYSLM